MTDGVELHVQQRGTTGPLVVALHGLFGDGDNLAGLAAELADDHRVLLPDLRNHGRSPWREGMALSALAGDVLALLDRLEEPRAWLVGHSLGGKVAMALALNQPERVAGLVVGDIAPVAYPPHHQAVFAGLSAVAAAEVGSRAEADALLARHVEDPRVRGFLLKSLTRVEGKTPVRFAWRFNWSVLQSDYEALSAAPAGRAYEGPALFLKGEQSTYILPEHEAVTRRLFPSFAFRMIAGTGHWLHAEKPQQFNRLVRNFLQGEGSFEGPAAP